MLLRVQVVLLRNHCKRGTRQLLQYSVTCMFSSTYTEIHSLMFGMPDSFYRKQHVLKISGIQIRFSTLSKFLVHCNLKKYLMNSFICFRLFFPFSKFLNVGGFLGRVKFGKTIFSSGNTVGIDQFH